MTGVIKGLSLDLGLDTAGIDTGLKGLKSQLSLVNSEMKLNMSAFDRGEKSVKKYETQLGGLNKKLDLQKSATSAAKVEYEKMVAEHGKGSVEANKAEKAYNDQAASLNNLERHVGSLTDEYKAFQREQEIANSGWTKAGESMVKQGDKMQQFGGKMTAVGGTMTKVSAGIVGGLAGVGVGLFAMVSKSAEAGDEVAKNAKRLGVTTDMYQEMDYWAGQNGVSHGDMEKSFKRLNQRIGEARGGNEKYSNALEKLGVDMNSLNDGTLTTEDAMTKSISTLSKMTNEQDKAALASEIFGTKLAQDLMPALQDGSLTMEEAKQKAAELGIVIGEDQLKASEAFQDAQDDMKRSMGMITTQIGLDLMPMFKNLTDYIVENLPRIKEVISNSLEKAGDVIMKTVGWFRDLTPTMKKTVAGFVAFGLALGPMLMIGGKVISTIGGMMKVFGGMSIAVGKAGGIMKLLAPVFTALTGPVAIAIGVIALLTAGFILAYKKSETFREFVHKVGDTVKDVFSKIGDWVKVGFDALMTFFSSIKDRFNAFQNEEGAQLMDAFKNIGKFIKLIMDGLVDAVKAGFTAIKVVIDFIMPAIKLVIDTVWKAIKGIITGALDVIMGAVKVFSGLFTGDFSKMWEGVKQIFSGAIKIVWNVLQVSFIGVIVNAISKFSDQIKKFFADMWKSATDIFNKAITGIANFVKSSWDNIANVTTTVFNGISKFFNAIWTTIWNFIKSIITKLYNDFKVGFNKIKDVTTTIFTAVWNFLKSIWTTVRDFIYSTVTSILNKIKDIWNTILNTTKSIFDSIYKSISGIFKNILSFITTTVTDIYNKIKGTWTNVKTATTEAFGDVYNSIKTRFTDIVNAAKALPKRIGDGIGSMASKVKTGVTKVINELASTLGKGVNGVIGGVNWVLGKIGVTSKIPTWTVPKYAQGTDGHVGGLAYVGDGKGRNAGRELIQTPDGKTSLSPAKETLVNLPKGTQVLSALNTRNLLGDVPKYANGIGKAWDKTKEIGKSIANKAFDIFDYIKNPSKLLDVALSSLGVKVPKAGSFIGDMAKGAFNKVKSGAVEFVKDKLAGFGESAGGAYGNASTGPGGAGSGFPGFGYSSGYGWRIHPKTGIRTFHNGDDYPAPAGKPIPNQVAGTVIRSQKGTGAEWPRGNFVQVRSGSMDRIYQHNSRNLVRAEQNVIKGQPVGLVGTTGSSTGNHLHYEVWKNGKPINPRGLATGGRVDEAGLFNLAEEGYPEFVIPTAPNRRTDAMKLLALAGKAIGGGGTSTGAKLPGGLSGDGGVFENMVNILLEQNQLLMKLLQKNTDVYLDGEQVGHGVYDTVDGMSYDKTSVAAYMKGVRM